MSRSYKHYLVRHGASSSRSFALLFAIYEFYQRQRQQNLLIRINETPSIKLFMRMKFDYKVRHRNAVSVNTDLNKIPIV